MERSHERIASLKHDRHDQTSWHSLLRAEERTNSPPGSSCSRALENREKGDYIARKTYIPLRTSRRILWAVLLARASRIFVSRGKVKEYLRSIPRKVTNFSCRTYRLHGGMLSPRTPEEIIDPPFPGGLPHPSRKVANRRRRLKRNILAIAGRNRALA